LNPKALKNLTFRGLGVDFLPSKPQNPASKPRPTGSINCRPALEPRPTGSINRRTGQ